MWRQLIEDPAMLDNTRSLMSTIARIIDNDHQDEEGGPAVTSGGRQTPREIRENDTEYVITVDVPGVDRAGIEVTYAGKVLTIAYQRVPAGEGRVIESTIQYGRSVQRLRLNSAAPDAAERITAKAECGELMVRVPKVGAPAVGAEPGKRVRVE
jgi:HSP20 family molecular chaperone IbpA